MDRVNIVAVGNAACPIVERNPNVEQWEMAENQLYLARDVAGHYPDYRAFFPFTI
jgi:hypothetical protein